MVDLCLRTQISHQCEKAARSLESVTMTWRFQKWFFILVIPIGKYDSSGKMFGKGNIILCFFIHKEMRVKVLSTMRAPTLGLSKGNNRRMKRNIERKWGYKRKNVSIEDNTMFCWSRGQGKSNFRQKEKLSSLSG